MVVRELVAVLGLDLKKEDFAKADAAIGKVKVAAKKLAVAFAGIAGVHALKETVLDARAAGDALDKLSGKLGVGTDALQEMQHAAELSGVAQRSFNLSLQRFTRRAAEAAQGTGTAKDAFAQMGIQLTDGQGRLRSTESMLADVADAMARTSDSGERVRLAFKLFDRDGVGMVNMLKGGSGALNDMRQEARSLGGVMSKELIAQLVALTDSLTRVAAIVRGFKYGIASALLPAINHLIAGYVRWRRENDSLLGQGLVVFLKALGRALSGFVLAVFAAGSAIARFVRKLDLVTKSLALALGLALALYVALSFPFVAAAAVALFLIGVVDDLFTGLRGGDSLIGRMAESFQKWVEEFSRLPIDPKEHWICKAMKYAAQAIKWAQEEFQALLDMMSGEEPKDDAGQSIYLTGKDTGDLKQMLGTSEGRRGLWEALKETFSSWSEFRRTFNMMPAGASSPQASAAVASTVHNRSVAVAPQQVTANITVNAAPGQAPRDTAREVVRELETRMSAERRAALSALTEGAQ